MKLEAKLEAKLKFSINSKVEIDWVSCESIKLAPKNMKAMNTKQAKEEQSTGHHMLHCASKLQCVGIQTFDYYVSFMRAVRGVFHFQNCIEIVCISRWRLPSTKLKKVFGKLKRKQKIITLKQIINYQNQNSTKQSKATRKACRVNKRKTSS